MGAGAQKPHAVCIPCPYQSHIRAMLSLAKILYHRGFLITFVNTDFNHRRLLRSRGPAALDGLPNFRFCSFPDGFPASDPDASQPIPAFHHGAQNAFLAPFLHLFTTHISHGTDAFPPPTIILADIFMPFIHAAGDKLQLPVICFATISACALMGIHKFQSLRGKPASADVVDDEDALLDWVPGMRNIRVRDVLNNFRHDGWDEAAVSNFARVTTELASVKAAALLINAVEEMERDALDGLASMYRRVYAVGPIHLLVEHIPAGSPVASMGSNLWKEESDCLRWLDGREPGSAVYVNFGSVAVATPEEISELAWGLAATNRSFLWVVRPDLQAGLPPEFREQTVDRILVASWSPQMEVLRHPSVGAFLTHSGWNSTLESASSGVPMICRPFFGDQHTNCRIVSAEWEIGVVVEERMAWGDLVLAVKAVMEGEGGRRMKERAMALKKLAHQAADLNGSSAMNMERFVAEAR